jgi:hypothetical protein
MRWSTEHIMVEHGRGGVTMQLEPSAMRWLDRMQHFRIEWLEVGASFGQRKVLCLLPFSHLFWLQRIINGFKAFGRHIVISLA